jgi:hypothetical protein
MDFRDRPSCTEILQQLERMEFRLIACVNSAKIAMFIKAIEILDQQLSSGNGSFVMARRNPGSRMRSH